MPGSDWFKYYMIRATLNENYISWRWKSEDGRQSFNSHSMVIQWSFNCKTINDSEANDNRMTREAQMTTE